MTALRPSCCWFWGILKYDYLQAPSKDAVRDVCVQSHRHPGRLLAETTAATFSIPAAQAAQVGHSCMFIQSPKGWDDALFFNSLLLWKSQWIGMKKQNCYINKNHNQLINEDIKIAKDCLSCSWSSLSMSCLITSFSTTWTLQSRSSTSSLSPSILVWRTWSPRSYWRIGACAP